MSRKFAANDELHLTERLCDSIDEAESLTPAISKLTSIPALQCLGSKNGAQNDLSDNDEYIGWEEQDCLQSQDLNRRDSGVSAVDLEIDET